MPAAPPASAPAPAGAAGRGAHRTPPARPRPLDVTLAAGEDAGLGLLGQAGMVAVRVADLARREPGAGGRTALTAAGTGKIRTGDVVVFCKPVAIAPAVVRRDGQVQAAGHPADHARLGVAEDRLDELCGTPGMIDEIAAAVTLDGKVKGSARRAMTPALAIRFTLLMTLMPADYSEVMQALLGDLALVPWQRRYRVPTATVASTWREAFGSAGTANDSSPYPQLRELRCSHASTRSALAVVTGPSGAAAGGARDKGEAEQALLDKVLRDCPQVFTPARLWIMDRNFPGAPRIQRMLATGTHVLIRVKSDIPLRRTGEFLTDGSYLAEISGGGVTLTVRVIEYTITVAGQDAPELFALITDLLDHAAYPAEALAAAYHWRWIGSESCLKEAKSAISGAGPSTGAMLRSQSPPARVSGPARRCIPARYRSPPPAARSSPPPGPARPPPACPPS